MATKLYCLCRKPYEANEFMIECEVCKDWFHGRCVGVKEHQASDIETYHCPSCQITHGPLVLKKRRVIQRQNYSELDDNITKIVQTGTMTFIRELKQRTFPTGDEIPLIQLSGYQLTPSYLEQQGFIVPILVDKTDGLDLKVPPSNFTIQDVENNVGSLREIDVIDVARQEDFKMLMRDWTEYYNSPDRRSKIYNVISLEFSNTRLAELVSPPRIVREMSWVSNYWPMDSPIGLELDPASPSSLKPEIQRYCLMGVKDSFTDFHIDFGGTSVWYHVLRGEKIFYFVRPTATNLSLYETWLSSSNQNETFFGDQVDVCYRCVIKQGETVFIPSGWIHAVLTPVDSLVFGGNFLHSLSIELQIRVFEIEKRVQTPEKYLFPYYETLHWFTAQHILNYLTGCHLSGKQPPRYLVEGAKVLCTALKSWAGKKDSARLQSLVPTNIQPGKFIKDFQKELKNFLSPRESASLRDFDELVMDFSAGKRAYRKKSNSATAAAVSPTKPPGTSLMSPLRMPAKHDFLSSAAPDPRYDRTELRSPPNVKVGGDKDDAKPPRKQRKHAKKTKTKNANADEKPNTKIGVTVQKAAEQRLLSNDWSLTTDEGPSQSFECDPDASFVSKDDRSPARFMLTSHAVPFADGFDPFHPMHAIDDFEFNSVPPPGSGARPSADSALYDFVNEECVRLTPGDSATQQPGAARWVEGLVPAAASGSGNNGAPASLKLKVAGGKIIGATSSQPTPGKFVPLTGSSGSLLSSPPPPVARGDDSDSNSNEHLVVDESRRSSAIVQSGLPLKPGSLKLKLSVSKAPNTPNTVQSLKISAGGDFPGADRRASVAGASVKSPSAGGEFVNRLSIPVIRGGLNSNISDILEASGYGTETDIRIDDEYSCASPKMRDAIQGMLSMSCGSRLLNNSALLRSPHLAGGSAAAAGGSRFVHKKSPLVFKDDIDAKLMSCYKDSEFVYPGLDISDSEDDPKAKNADLGDEAWNPKAKVQPSCPKPERKPRQGVKREAVENTLAATAAKLSSMPPRKRMYVKRKPKVVKKPSTSTPATCLAAELPVASTSTAPAIPAGVGLSASAPASIMSAAIGAYKQGVQSPSKAKKLKKGMATAKQRLGKKLKIHKMIF